MKLFVITSFVIAGLALISGCAFTDSTLRLKYDIPETAVKEKPIPQMSIKKFVDSRRIDNAKLLYYKNNAFGDRTNGRFLNEDVTVADFTTEVIRKTVEKAGIKVVDDSEFVLSGKILSLEPSMKTGGFTAKVESTIATEIQLTRGSQVLRKKSVVAKGTSDTTDTVSDKDYSDSLERMFRNLSSSVLEFITSVP